MSAKKNPNRIENGMWLRGRIWWVVYRHGGKTIRESTRCTRKTDAVAFLAERRTASHRGTLVVDARKVTFEDLRGLIEADYTAKGNRSTPKLTRLTAAFAGWHAVDITTDRVRRYEADRLAAGAARGTVNSELAALRRMFRLAIEAGKVSAGPIVRTPDPHNAREGFWEPAEFARFRDALPVEVRPVATFLYLTGWRIGEVLGLRWRGNVDLAGGVIRLEGAGSKNKQARTFPFDALPDLKMLIERQLATGEPHSSSWVFHIRGKRITYEIWNEARKKACKAARCEGKLAHDFRRTAVRNLERAGVPRSVGMKLTGHVTESVYRRYAIVNEADQRAGVAKLAAVLAPIPG